MPPVNPDCSYSRPATLGGKIATTLFLFVFFAMGSGFLVLMSHTLFKSISTMFWTDTACRVVSSRIDEEGRNGHGRYVFKINYSYEFGGKRFNSDKVSSGYAGDSSYSKAQSLLSRYPADSQARCRVNPGNPAESVLTSDPSIFIMLPFMLIPLIFVLFGAGGIYSVWTGWSIRGSPAGNSADRKNFSSSKAAVILFSVFLLIGLLVFYFLGIRPAMKVLDAKSWTPAQCRIISSSVAAHDSDNGHTYSVDILYSYVIGGKEYKSDRYNFMGGSSSGYDGKKKVVDAFPAGSTATCYANPADPSDSVLNRGFTWEFLFCLIPLAFILVGAGGLIYNIRKRSEPQMNSGEYDRGGFSDYTAGDVVLKPVSGPFLSFLGSILIAGFWNGLVSIFVYQDVLSWMKGRPDWFLTIFLVPFVLVGLVMLGMVALCFIGLFNPRPRLSVSTTSPHPGGKLKVQWEINARSSELFRNMSISLKCMRGGNGSGGNIIDELGIIDTSDSFRIACGSREIDIPENAATSADSSRDGNEIRWLISFKGALARRPRISLDYRIRVVPRKR